MRIITDYWDYYDSVQAYASDTKDVYIRRRQEVKQYDDYGYLLHGHSASTNTDIVQVPRSVWYGYSVDIIGFCGVLYPIKVSKSRNIALNKWGYNADRRYWYHDYEIDDDFNVYQGKKELIENEKYYKKDKINYLDQLLNSNIFHNIFQDKKVPLFVATKMTSRDNRYERYEINYAPMLKKYHFDRIFNEFQAFQEIEMFFSNVIYDRENPDPQITDNVVLRDAKGFDTMSFKNGPKKRGRK